MAWADGNPPYAAWDYAIFSMEGSADALARKIPKRELLPSWVSASENPIEAKFAQLPTAKRQRPFSVNGPIAPVYWLYTTIYSIVKTTIKIREVICRP